MGYDSTNSSNKIENPLFLLFRLPRRVGVTPPSPGAGSPYKVIFSRRPERRDSFEFSGGRIKKELTILKKANLTPRSLNIRSQSRKKNLPFLKIEIPILPWIKYILQPSKPRT